MNKSRAYEVYMYFRDEAGMTDYQVAKATGLTTASLAQWKRGDYNLKLEKLQKLAKLFSIPVDAFWDHSYDYRYGDERA